MESPISFKSATDVKQYLQQHPIPYIKIALFDLNGVLRGKTISLDKFNSILENGGSFYDGILGGDIDDQLTDNMQFTGTHTGYPDAKIEIIPESGRRIPWEPNSLFFLCQFAETHNTLCPRGVLNKVLHRAADMGFSVKSGMEYEFTVLDESDVSIREKDYRKLEPFTAGNFGYSIQRSTYHHDLHQDLLDTCAAMNMPIECLHTEIGPGMLEAALVANDGVTSADNAALFKAFCKSVVERHDLLATFMAKWREDVQGHGAHIHISLLEKNKNVFYDANDAHGMSTLMKHFVAGQQQLMPEFLVMCAPTINSYARYVPDCWAPTEAVWGYENRAVSLRVVEAGAKGQRIEYRIAGADCNPYLAMAAAIASGLYGIEQQLELPPAYEPVLGHKNKTYPLPNTLQQATDFFADSSVAKNCFGEDFVTDYAASREWEVRQYNKAVTDWQLRRYLDTI